jgi:hypothetical protein
MTRQTKSPLKHSPLRNPGQSVDEQLDDLLANGFLLPCIVAIFVVLLAALEWWRAYKLVPPNPQLYTVLAALALAYAAFRMAATWPALRRLKLGRDGERFVGQFLEGIRAQGYEVFHDVPGDGFNIDHVLVGPAGIFTIETKTRSKPLKGDSRVQFDGEALRINGHADRNPVEQARAQANWLRRIVFEFMGRKVPLRPVILYPGWFVEQAPGSTKCLWVLEPKALPAFLEREPVALSETDVKAVAFHLRQFLERRAG